MPTAASEPPVSRIRRAHVFAYLFFLQGGVFVLDNVASMLADGVVAATAAGACLGLFGVLAGFLSLFRPEEYGGGTDPASRAVLALATVATVAFAFLVVSAPQ
ncbi:MULTISPECIES: hypothetical protein [Halorussus]|uniref:hypothetical protein n=1 Tax=Halorussus TaxID=1070314 RepID=UPI0020A145DE|nr:hypothetical protein [Halorussus vallis]USZ77470.1 hypothetical protein NGM07_09080 [Halorussus vallis]